MDFISPNWVDAPDWIGALSTTRKGGVSHAPYDDAMGGGGFNLALHVGDSAVDVARNRAILRAMLPAEPCWLSQVHGAHVVEATHEWDAPKEADASFTTQPGVVCAVQSADCLPVLFCDTTGHVVAAAHAGWRGLSAGVLENTVAKMRAAGAGDIVAWLGPAIGPTQFEVGDEVVAAFVNQDRRTHAAFVRLVGKRGKYLANIYRLARDRLMQIGVQKINGGQFCTVTMWRHFYSYRRDHLTGRMASFIWIKPLQ